MLEHLSPREFEEYCQLLMMALHGCKVEVTQQARDGGRDLLVRHPSGLWIVECKHWPTGTVGRPVVQKLHSATLTSNSCRAMIVTTGRFSQDAEVYAQSLTDIEIDLIDMAKLAHMISVAFPNGALPTNLSVAIKTTPDAAFPQIFAQSIFSPDRFQRGTSAKNPVRVTRDTRYETYFIAKYSAEGSVNTAVGHFSATWQDSIWISADGSAVGFGSPNAYGRKLGPLVSLAEALATVPGTSDPPELQPHQATAKMKEFVLCNCVKSVWYKGRNNVNYSKTIQPSASTIVIESLKLCYIPFQEFVLEIGGTSYEGEVDERGSPPEFHIDCPELSTCTVCGTGTTPDDQILCSICFRPAHEWTFLFPDSYECHKCNGIMCRHHSVKDGKKYFCTRCTVAGKPLGPRWLPHCLIGLSGTGVAVLSPVISLISYLLIEPRVATMILLIVGIAAGILGLACWLPWLCIVSQKSFLSSQKNLTYPKVDA
jgi:restriction system protein